jgi:hypothetical protein
VPAAAKGRGCGDPNERLLEIAGRLFPMTFAATMNWHIEDPALGQRCSRNQQLATSIPEVMKAV